MLTALYESKATLYKLQLDDCDFDSQETCIALANLMAVAPSFEKLIIQDLKGNGIRVKYEPAQYEEG